MLKRSKGTPKNLYEETKSTGMGIDLFWLLGSHRERDWENREGLTRKKKRYDDKKENYGR